ncbi:glutamate-1-semialdehyde 2,1-aminomutase [Maridesulfovibrio ferrireducens]|uniref:Glutamate-1-semialdehyde 2,1-aminomutase n=1 Tax=Maridesulfovibrio ferrireducens TaxID=246191 RepID=A0A1G9G4D5_9BACT|nr:glutamate-1-semialdehyde 2,1-aminomutase [Maridesulfovibrio ferrireducens]SDK95574.1 glutamate-1-semialdehyde 2,1-aminomutase [Maridesulfovibrio ferrireducens]
MASSSDLFKHAQEVLPGGVNSPVRACKSVGCEPLFIEKADGSRMWSVDGQELIDYVMSWGPMILGHGYQAIKDAAHKAVDMGASFGAPCPDEITLAEEIIKMIPSIDMVRMVNSGTEATMSALRLARGVTGRDKVLKFEGCYHGHSDCFLASAGSGLATFCIPGTPGVPEGTVKDTLLAPYNDLAAVKAVFEKEGKNIAAIIVEPVAGNMGLVLPAEGFLQGLRDICDEYGALLIFDEVITGFRVASGGVQKRFGIEADLTTLGKIIGGGFPVGAYGGKRKYMSRISPCGDVYQAGTLSGNPVAMAAGIATLRTLQKQDYDALEARTLKLAQDLKAALEANGFSIHLNHIASIFTLFFTDKPVTDFESAKNGNADVYSAFYRHMRANGFNLAPSSFECTFTSFAHSEADYEATLEAVKSFKG